MAYGNFDHLMDQINARFDRVERAIENGIGDHAKRIDSLERTRDEQNMLVKVFVFVSGVFGAALATVFNKFWSA